MDATTKTRKRRMERIANIAKASVNVAFPHSFPSSILKLAPELEPARVALESLPQDVQNHITGHTATMINLFDDVE